MHSNVSLDVSNDTRSGLFDLEEPIEKDMSILLYLSVTKIDSVYCF